MSAATARVEIVRAVTETTDTKFDNRGQAEACPFLFSKPERHDKHENETVLLGTGTPNACPWASGPASAVVVDGHAYLVDFGPGVVRRAAEAYRRGEDALRPDLLDTAFCTHLHTDHTAGFADLIFTPWVLEREKPLKVFGPKGIRNMAQHLLSAYAVDIDFRLHGFERANRSGRNITARCIRSART